MPDRAEVLRAWVSALIPARGERPAAGEVGAAEYVDATVFLTPRLRGVLLDGIDTVDQLAVRNCAGRRFAEATLERADGGPARVRGERSARRLPDGAGSHL